MAFESEVVLRCVLTCRRDRRHGKPGGLLHAGAGVASLAGCSTGGGQHWVETRAVGKGGQGRLESRPQARKPAPQKQPAPQKGVCDTGADTLVRPYRARHWVEQGAVGKGCPGRLESRPQARKPAPLQMLAPQE